MSLRIAVISSRLGGAWRRGKTGLWAYLITIILSSLTFAYGIIDPSLVLKLSLSRATPWGIITSLFVHTTFMYYCGNMLTILGLTIILEYLINLSVYVNRRKASPLFRLAPILSGIGANTLYFTVLIFEKIDRSTTGASGIAYAMMGVILAISLHNVISHIEIVGIRASISNREYRKRYFMPNIVISLLILINITFFTSSFLSVQPGINTFVHFWGFVLGLSFSVSIYYYFRERSRFSPIT